MKGKSPLNKISIAAQIQTAPEIDLSQAGPAVNGLSTEEKSLPTFCQRKSLLLGLRFSEATAFFVLLHTIASIPNGMTKIFQSNVARLNQFIGKFAILPMLADCSPHTNKLFKEACRPLPCFPSRNFDGTLRLCQGGSFGRITSEIANFGNSC
jgi:hypothetical protein